MFAAAQIQCRKISRGLLLDTPRRREAAWLGAALYHE